MRVSGCACWVERCCLAHACRRMRLWHELMRRWPHAGCPRKAAPPQSSAALHGRQVEPSSLPCALQNATLHDEKATQVEQDEDLLNIVLGALRCAVLHCAEQWRASTGYAVQRLGVAC